MFSSFLFLMGVVSFLPGAVHASASTQPSETRPNIVFFIVDDLGWGNVEYHRKPTGSSLKDNILGKEVRTPNINHYAKTEGLELNRHYVHGTCTPTRSSFFSGRLPVHVQTGLAGPEAANSGVPRYMTTLPKLLKEKAGYTTHMIGKWDLGFASYNHTPKGRGFDTSLIYTEHGGDYWTYKIDPRVAVCNYYPGFGNLDDLWTHGAYGGIGNADYEGPAREQLDNPKYMEYMFKKRGNSFLQEYAKAKKNGEEQRPFFLMYASHLMHQPLQIPEREIIHDRDAFPSDPWVCSYATVYVNKKRRDARKFGCRRLYSSMVRMMDKIFGQVMQKLKDENLWDNTLVVFSSDNGGSTWVYESAASNYPLRGGKYSDFEGGIRAVSFVTGGYLPKERKGETEHGMIHVSDWYATFLSLAGLKSAEWQETDENIANYGYPQVDSLNVWPVVSKGDTSPRKDIHVGETTLIAGRYKYMEAKMTNAGQATDIYPTNMTVFGSKSVYDGVMDCSHGCLFDVVANPIETKDISGENQDVVDAMRQTLVEYNKFYWVNQDNHDEDSCPSECTLTCPHEHKVCGEDLDWELMSESGDRELCVPCGCWMSKYRWGGNVGPFQNIEDVPACQKYSPTCESEAEHSEL